MSNLVFATNPFGNKFSYRNEGNGKKSRNTRSDHYSEFIFLGNVYTFGMLLCKNETLKTYYKDRDEEAELQRDVYGRLLLYFYDYYSDCDRTDYLWVLVESENDADQMVKDARLDRLRIPFIAADGENWLGATEWV